MEEIIAWVHAAAAGQSSMSPRIAAALLRRISESPGEGEEAIVLRLSARELKVLSSILMKVRVPGRSGSSSMPTQR